jgi:hypothetical protein
MDDEQNEQKAQPKISVVDMVLVGLFLAILDAIDLIPFAGDLTDIPASMLIFYYTFKGINGVAYIISLIMDAIPGLQEIPTRSIVWWGTVIIDRIGPKKLERALEKAGELTQGKVGAAGAEAEAAGALSKGTEVAENMRTAGGAASEGEALAAGEAGVRGAEQDIAAGNNQGDGADALRSPEEQPWNETLEEDLLKNPRENTFTERSLGEEDEDEEPDENSAQDEQQELVSQ